MSGDDLTPQQRKALRLLSTGADHVHSSTGRSLVRLGLVTRGKARGIYRITDAGLSIVNAPKVSP